MQTQYIHDEVKKALDLDLSSEQCAQMFRYYNMLIEKNKVMNLTRITDFEDAVTKHFIDSLSLIKAFNPSDYSHLQVIDLGCGAGLPGIPVKIAWPHCELTMVDSVGKKLGFVREAVEELNLTQVNVIHGRAEDLARKPEYREKFDLCTSRAVANLSTLSEYCIPFIKKGGYFISYKSGESDPEIEEGRFALQLMGGGKPELIRFNIDGNSRILLKSRKIKETPGIYPRKAGTPSKEPIKGTNQRKK